MGGNHVEDEAAQRQRIGDTTVARTTANGRDRQYISKGPCPLLFKTNIATPLAGLAEAVAVLVVAWIIHAAMMILREG
jgi:glutathionyl-hydroquinone reductase